MRKCSPLVNEKIQQKSPLKIALQKIIFENSIFFIHGTTFLNFEISIKFISSKFDSVRLLKFRWMAKAIYEDCWEIFHFMMVQLLSRAKKKKSCRIKSVRYFKIYNFYLKHFISTSMFHEILVTGWKLLTGFKNSKYKKSATMEFY